MVNLVPAEFTLSDRRFFSYINVCLGRYAARWKKTIRARAGRESLTLNQPVLDGDGNPIEEIERIAPAIASAEDAYLHTASVLELIEDYGLFQSFRELAPRQSQILLSVVLRGERQLAVAKRLNVTQQAVNRSKEQALRRLRVSVQGVTRRGRTPASNRQFRFSYGGECLPLDPVGNQA